MNGIVPIEPVDNQKPGGTKASRPEEVHAVCLGNRCYILSEDEIVGTRCSTAVPTWHNGEVAAGGVPIAPTNGGSIAAGGVARAPADDTVVTTGNLGRCRARRLQIHCVQPTLIPSPR
jgi:hypothetical protein